MFVNVSLTPFYTVKATYVTGTKYRPYVPITTVEIRGDKSEKFDTSFKN